VKATAAEMASAQAASDVTTTRGATGNDAINDVIITFPLRGGMAADVLLSERM